MEEGILLMLNQVTTEWGCSYLEMETFADFYTALGYISDVKEKKQMFRFDLYSPQWHISYIADTYPHIDRGKLTIQIDSKPCDTYKIALILDAIDRTLHSDEYREAS